MTLLLPPLSSSLSLSVHYAAAARVLCAGGVGLSEMGMTIITIAIANRAGRATASALVVVVVVAAAAADDDDVVVDDDDTMASATIIGVVYSCCVLLCSSLMQSVDR